MLSQTSQAFVRNISKKLFAKKTVYYICIYSEYFFASGNLQFTDVESDKLTDSESDKTCINFCTVFL